jgi:hypothetical protein
MKRALLLAATLLTALPPVIALAVTVQSNLAITITSSGSGGDPTIGLLPSYNDVYANWKMAGMQSVGGIPNRTTVCATLTPLGGSQIDTTQINNAIAACPAGEVVQLNAGTFNLSAGGSTSTIYLQKGVTLRGCTATPCTASRETDNCNASSGTAQNSTVGAGANLVGSPYCETVINVVGGAQVGVNGCTGSGCNVSTAVLVGAGGGTGNWNTPTTLTADAAQGATSVQVASTSRFSVGQWVLIDELDGASWQPDPATGSGYASGGQVWAAPDWTSSSGSPATGRVAWQLHNPGKTGDDGTNVFCWYSKCSATNARATAELHHISAISGNTITFDSPLTVAFRQSGGHAAQLYAPNTAFVQNAGIENLTIQGSTQGGVYFQFCAYCWARGVEVETWLNGGIDVTYAARTEINHDFIHTAAWPLPGGAEYAIDLQDASTEMYVVDTISMLAGKGMTERAAGAGNVIAYNYFDKILVAYALAWQEMGANGSHVGGSHMTLFEGNWTHNLDDDSTHGSESYHTFFRNLAPGLRTPFFQYFPGYPNVTQDDSRGVGVGRAAGQQEYNYWHAFVGNVLGTSGLTTSAHGWQLNGAYSNNGADNWPGIWLLGWRDVVPQPVDPNVATRTFRHGNYDYHDNSIHWDSNTSDHNLSNSFYLTSTPSFFSAGTTGCTYPWPWVDPTATPQFTTNSCGGSGNPAKARFDAGTPFVQP